MVKSEYIVKVHFEEKENAEDFMRLIKQRWLIDSFISEIKINEYPEEIEQIKTVYP